MKLVSWNINSVRLRIDQVIRFLYDEKPDVLALQEIKCQTHEFPKQPFIDAGYSHFHICGQKGWHGVALVSKHPFEILETPTHCKRGEARAQAINIEGITVWNFYIPAGGDTPDRVENIKFDHKLEFYERLTQDLKAWDHQKPLILMGDLNIAPGEFDVWNHRHMLKVVSHTPIELETFGAMVTAGQFFDPFRVSYPNPQKIFSWWSYRSADFRVSNRGLRLDHILLNPRAHQLYPKSKAIIFDAIREWKQPSDHAPIQVSLE
jgi:exodeoxyribonuclease-3